MNLVLFGGSKLTIDDSLKKDSSTLIKLLGDRFKYVYGGGNDGIMGTVCNICLENKYSISGVNCKKWKSDSDLLLNNIVYYDNIIDRQTELIVRGDGYICLPGGVGTLFEALQCITLNDTKEQNKPIFFLNTDNYFMHFFSMLEMGRKHGTVSKTNKQLNITVRDTPDELSDEIQKLIS
jgi:uncharacterized protein (TIGR00730 family)